MPRAVAFWTATSTMRLWMSLQSCLIRAILWGKLSWQVMHSYGLSTARAVCAVLVEDEPLAAHEGLPADPTHVRMPAQVHCVHRIVGVELSPAGKPLAAKRAGVVLLVGPLVYGQSVFPAEALPTHVTLKWPLPRMPPHVDHEALSQRKPFLADVADVGGLAIPGAPPRHSNGSARFVLTWLVFGLVFWWKKLARVGLLFPVAPLVSLDTLPAGTTTS
ncbi:hypothetical protein HPB48_008853 [Haemaphysalis longicornis]|uniref:Uncharacterized protein n=1 Tax=Haemaphysalis longicornis TaxID=44386 RepID=A0A9J6GZA3_HAELO|nr:hypothetical protein HPB48_008853 [Haemaphysalis longicornis]